MNRRHHAVPLHEAADAAPSLARLAQLVRESSERLRAIESFIPASLRPAVQAGPIEGDTWCLLVDSSAAAAKLRQVLPAMVGELGSRGWQVTAIRVKVQIRQK